MDHDRIELHWGTDFDLSVVCLPGQTEPCVRMRFAWPSTLPLPTTDMDQVSIHWADDELALHAGPCLVFVLPPQSPAYEWLVDALLQQPCLLIQADNSQGEPLLAVEFGL